MIGALTCLAVSFVVKGSEVISGATEPEQPTNPRHNNTRNIYFKKASWLIVEWSPDSASGNGIIIASELVKCKPFKTKDPIARVLHIIVGFSRDRPDLRSVFRSRGFRWPALQGPDLPAVALPRPVIPAALLLPVALPAAPP